MRKLSVSLAHRSQYRRSLLIILISLLISMVGMVGVGPVFAPVYATLYVDPPSIIDPTKTAGTTFTVNINVKDVIDLYTFDFRLNYSTAVLTATEVTLGSFFPPGSMIWVENIDDDTGYIWYTVGLPLGTRKGEGVSGSGTLATISFTVDAEGETILDLSFTGLSNSYAILISHEVYDGFFSNKPIIHDIAITKVTTTVTTVKVVDNVTIPEVKPVSEVHAGEKVNITVYVKNNGTVTESFNVTAYYDTTPISTKNVTALLEGFSTTLTFEWNTEGVAEGNYTIWAEASVVAGEINTANNKFIKEGKFKVLPIHDISPPSAPVISSTTHPEENAWYSNNDLTFEWSTPSDISGIAGYSYILDQSPTTIPYQTIDTTENSKSYADLGDGTWYFHVRSKDNAGNWGSAEHYQVNIDTQSPSGTISINQGATYATSTSVTLTLTYSDAASGVSKVRYSNDGIWDTEQWENPSGNRAWTLTSGDEVKTVYAQFKDNAGQTSTTYSDTIILDTSPPTGSIKINNDATETTSTSVTLTLSANDANGVAQMRFSNDGSTWSSWETFETSRLWTLTSDYGTKTVYVEFKDNAGLVSSAYLDAINLVSPPMPTWVLWIVGGLVILLAAMAIAIVALIRRKK